MLHTNILKKILITSFALGLTACANTEGLEASITNLSNKVDSLSKDVAELKAQQQISSEDAKAAKMAAQKANERIDNVVATYTK